MVNISSSYLLILTSSLIIVGSELEDGITMVEDDVEDALLEVVEEVAMDEVQASTVASKLGPGPWAVLEFRDGESEEDVSLWCKRGFEIAILLIPSLYKQEESAILKEDEDTAVKQSSFRCLCCSCWGLWDSDCCCPNSSSCCWNCWTERMMVSFSSSGLAVCLALASPFEILANILSNSNEGSEMFRRISSSSVSGAKPCKSF